MTFFPDQYHSFIIQPMNKTTNGFLCSQIWRSASYSSWNYLQSIRWWMDGPNDVKGRVGRREDKREHKCCKRGLLTTQTASQQSYYSANALWKQIMWNYDDDDDDWSQGNTFTIHNCIKLEKKKKHVSVTLLINKGDITLHTYGVYVVDPWVTQTWNCGVQDEKISLTLFFIVVSYHSADKKYYSTYGEYK